MRRRTRGWAERARRLPRFRGRYQAPGSIDDQGALRQFVRHVPDDYRGERIRSADADLPGAALHHGWLVGRLQFDEQHPWPVRAGRGEFLGSWRESSQCQRVDAGARRWLFCDSLYDWELFCLIQAATPADIASGIQKSRRKCARDDEAFSLDEREAHADFIPSRTRETNVG